MKEASLARFRQRHRARAVRGEPAFQQVSSGGANELAGFTGEQFARPEAIDLLRSVRRQEICEELDIAPADPLNLTGIILPGPRVSMISVI